MLAQVAGESGALFGAVAAVVQVGDFVFALGIDGQQQSGNLQPLQNRPGVVLQARLGEFLFQHAAAVEPEMIPCKFLDQFRINPERLADITHRAARPVADDGRGNGSAVMAVFFVDVLDDFFTPLVFEIDVDVRWLFSFAADETLEQRVAFHRVNRRHAQAVADGGIGRRTATLAKNFLASGKTHDVMHRDEKHLVFKLFDQRQLFLDADRDFSRYAFGVAFPRAHFRQAPQALRRRFDRWHHVFFGITVHAANFIQIEGAARRHFERGAQQISGINFSQPHARAQMRFGIDLQLEPAFVHRFTELDGGQHVMQRLA